MEKEETKKQSSPREKVKKTVKHPPKEQEETVFGEPLQEKTEEKTEKILKPGRYFEAIGRRKSATARVRLSAQPGEGFSVNGKPYQQYFPTLDLRQLADASLKKMKCFEKFGVSALVSGGGIHAQAEAIRHGTARALVKFNLDFKKRLRRAGYLTRDPRQRERKKFGLKRARRAPQWRKR